MNNCAVASAVVAVAALAFNAAAGSPVAAGGSITGVVNTREVAPAPIRVTVDPRVCGESVKDDSVVVDAAGHVSGAVISLAGVKQPAPADAAVVNDGCRFVPRVSIVRPKGTIRMSSRDAVMHTVHAAAPGGKALFNLSLPIPNAVLSRPIDRPGIVTLSCSTHTWMRGYLFVTEDAATLTGVDGSFRLDGVPAGTREVRIWHETLKAAPVSVTVRDGETTSVNIVLTR
jgi:plastocyanin